MKKLITILGIFFYSQLSAQNNIGYWDKNIVDSLYYWDTDTNNIGCGYITVIFPDDSILYVGGAFNRAGNIQANGITYRKNYQWNAMGAGIYGQYPQVITKYQNKLLVGGSFLTAGNLDPWTSGSAYWDGTNWSYTGFYAGAPWDFYPTDTILFIGIAGDGNTIKTWDGTNYLDGTTGPGCPYSYAGGSHTWSFCSFNDTLYAGSYNYLYKYLGNRCWKVEPNGFDNIYHMVTDTINNLLYMGSYLVYMFDGYVWRDLHIFDFNIAPGCVYYKGLTIYRGDLYAGGSFDTLSNGIIAENIAYWNGYQWNKLGNGVNSPVYVLQTFHDSLWVGGYFDWINGYNYQGDSITPQHACGLVKWYMPPDTGCHYVRPFIYALKNGTPKDTFYLGTQNQAVVSFYNNNAYATHWFWDFGDGTTDTVRNPVHTYTTNGVYNVSLTIDHPQEKPLTGNCIKTAQKTVTILNGTEISVADMLTNFRLYPNPTTGDFNLECFLNGNKDGEVIVVNEKGNQLYKNHLYPGFNHLVIPSSQWTAGLMIINVLIEKKIIKSEKVVKSK